MLVATLDTQVVATALPTIVADLGGIRQFAWVSSAYLLAFTATAPFYGRLGDLLGQKRVFMFALGLFLAGSAACGVAQSMSQLIAFRAVQGIGAGGLTVSVFALLGELFDARQRARYMGYATAVFAVSSVTGPLVGGLITTHLGWRWVFFYINLPLGAGALALTATLLTVGRGRRRSRVDYCGIAALAGLAVCLVLLSNWAGTKYAWGSATIIGLLCGAAALLAAW
ncbi:MAG: MFS transporter, partial [Solirubrobacteraceae bacterium]